MKYFLSIILLSLLSGCIEHFNSGAEFYEYDIEKMKIKLYDVRPKIDENIDTAWSEISDYLKINNQVDSSKSPYLLTYKSEIIRKKNNVVDLEIIGTYKCPNSSSCFENTHWDKFLDLIDKENRIVANKEVIIPLEYIADIDTTREFEIKSNMREIRTNSNILFAFNSELKKVFVSIKYKGKRDKRTFKKFINNKQDN